MKIKTSNKEIEVKSILGEQMHRGNHQYPSLKIVMPGGITEEDIAALIEGSFTIIEVDQEGNVNEYVHDGYNTVTEVAVSIAKITTDEQQIEDLESRLNEAQAEYDTVKAELDAAKAEYEEVKNNLEIAKAEAAEMQEAINIIVEGEVE